MITLGAFEAGRERVLRVRGLGFVQLQMRESECATGIATICAIVLYPLPLDF